jgi:starch phosphorylase
MRFRRLTKMRPEVGRELPRVAYFSMEIGLAPEIHTYSGGLGILAGDTLRAAADLGLPMVGVTLLYREGYFRQELDGAVRQVEHPDGWNPEELLTPLPLQVEVPLEGRKVRVGAWRYEVTGVSGHIVPVYLLDTDLEGNEAWDRTLSHYLYGGDDRYRLCQEIVLGFGGVALLEALNQDQNIYYHMNEGHAALLTLALLGRRLKAAGRDQPTDADVEAVRHQCVFTTHTPVPAGHDQFPRELVEQVLGRQWADLLILLNCCLDWNLNMTYLGLRFARYINGVSMRHDEISTSMFPEYPVNAITNGVHAPTWTAPPFQEMFDRHIPEWRQDNFYLRYAVGIPLHEIDQAHAEAKRLLLAEVARAAGERLDERVLTIGFARRATRYKRIDLLFTDLERLQQISRQVGPLQVIYGGKAHPRDEGGKAMIRRVFAAKEALKEHVPLVFVENYDMAWAKLITAGVDLWLNTPQRPQEASGTSGMKAALNGVPSLSILDGWWVEGHVENVTGWAIGDGREPAEEEAQEVTSMYDKLERVILPMYYGRPQAYAEVRRGAIALNGSFFNTQRMLGQYVSNAYRLNSWV